MASAVSRSVLDQLKNKTVDDWIRALKKDGWAEEQGTRGTRGFVKHSIDEGSICGDHRRRVVIHYHPKKRYGPGLVKMLLRDTQWNDDDLRRLKMIR